MGRTRRKKKVTQKPTPDDGGGVEEGKKVPKAFVIERGKVGHILNQLVLDIRQILEPNTATKLKVRHKNVLKDFVAMAGPLGVTHLLSISRTVEFVNLKVCVLPRGPTITFHVKAFALTREVLASLKAPSSNPAQFLTPPMLVLNNFSSEDKAAHLLSTVFQNLFPSINVHTVKLANIKRCLLLNFDPESKLIELRHYATRVVPRGTTRGVKKLSRTKLPNLSKLSDISEYLLGGYASESDGEEMGQEGEVTLPQDMPGKANIKSEQSTVRLSELGPRLTLQLVKIEAGLCEGEVLHHEYVQKNWLELRRLHKAKEKQRLLKESRKKEQAANVARKQREKEEHKARCLAGMGGEEEGSSEGGGEGEEESSEDEDDREWFRREVGEEPDQDLFGSDGKGKVRSHKHLLSGMPRKRRKLSSFADPPGGRKRPRDSSNAPGGRKRMAMGQRDSSNPARKRNAMGPRDSSNPKKRGPRDSSNPPGRKTMGPPGGRKKDHT